jgi:GT2 family glycosyltransferase
MPSVSVCICTRNRPEELRRTLDSVARSTRPVEQILVSDDSTDERTRDVVVSEYPEVTYVRGPRTGLGANRNAAARAATEDLVLFLDDDCLLGERFLEHAFRALSVEGWERTIVTGLETNGGDVVEPADQDFLGFQRLTYAPGAQIKTVVINSALFPRALFGTVRFDEQLVYGCDEVDLTTRAVAAGFTIRLSRAAVNDHRPSQVNRDYYGDFATASRIYVTFKRYFVTEQRRLKGALFLPVALGHAVASAVRHRGPSGVVTGIRAAARSIAYIGRLGPASSSRTARQ